MLNNILRVSLASVVLVPCLAGHVKHVPPGVSQGDSSAPFVYTGQNLEFPQVSSINATSFEWWYFDGVSYPDEDGRQSSLTILFFTATGGGFDLLKYAPTENPSVDLIDITITYPNGIIFRTELNDTRATFVSRGDQGVEGCYDGPSKATFSISPGSSQASVQISAQAKGVVGTYTLQSLAPPHLPGSPLELGQSAASSPNLGWFNSIPDSAATASFVVHGEGFEFQGRGYHDKNWGLQPAHTLAKVWYWGHVTLGDYSIVWGDVLGNDETEYTDIYISRKGELIAAQFGGITVRPIGKDAKYPPHASYPAPKGFTIISDQDLLDVTVSVGSVSSGAQGGPYYRWAGTATGTVDGDDGLTGPAFFEQLTFLP